jgi:2-iminobutanoate/2-iminopropanoate deaminase
MTSRVQISTDGAPTPGAALSQAMAVQGLVFSSGQVGVDPQTGEVEPDFESQVRRAISNLDAVLTAAGSGLGEVVKTTCYLVDMTQFAAFDSIYRSTFPAPWPARSTVQTGLVGELLFEIEAVALVPDPKG